MKKVFIVANWKSHETIPQVEEWFETFKSLSHFAEASRDKQLIFNKNEKKIIICPSFTLLPKAKELIVMNQLPIVVGAQNISPFDEGAYTGEENAKQIKEFADYVIIGHSERRKNFSETDEMLSKKAKEAIDNNLTPIFCVQSDKTYIPDGVSLVAYEPIFAIGTGKPDTPADAENVAKTIKENHPNVAYVLYGGSVNPEDVNGFTKMPSVDGVLVGGASLDAEKFMQIIKNA